MSRSDVDPDMHGDREQARGPTAGRDSAPLPGVGADRGVDAKGTSTLGPPRTSWVEWSAIVALLLMAVGLLWVNTTLRLRQGASTIDTFDLKNPMLDAQPGDAVEVISRDVPGQAPCIRVRPEAVVLRPASGPSSLGDRNSLNRHPPYLAASERHMPTGSACGAGTPLYEQVLLYPLNGFGLPSDAMARMDGVRPLVVQLRGQERLAYEVVLRDSRGWTWQAFLVPDAPVTGLVELRMHSGQANAQAQVLRFMEVGER